MEKSYVRKVSSRYQYDDGIELEIDVNRDSIKENTKLKELHDNYMQLLEWSLSIRISHTKFNKIETVFCATYYYTKDDMEQKKKIISRVFPEIEKLECSNSIKGDLRYKVDDAINMLELDADEYFAKYHGEY